MFSFYKFLAKLGLIKKEIAMLFTYEIIKGLINSEILSVNSDKFFFENHQLQILVELYDQIQKDGYLVKDIKIQI